MPTSSELRDGFIDFFKQLGHRFVPSSPVVPQDDPTLLFANAGMNQFKDVFLGIGRRDYDRVVNSQKCIRVSGKHNDLEQVGVDIYHHTFFEMLGNWSFGDYFKAEAIEWAWKLLTEIWALPKDRLYATVFSGDDELGLAGDEEAEELWKRVTDIDPSHVMRFGVKDNFWQMADTGPCGPCSEIHIDITADASGAGLVNADDPRVIEIWNLVFIQFDRDEAGRLTPLPAKHVDTGLGLERLAAVIKHLPDLGSGRQWAFSNYGTDLFVPIVQQIESLTGCKYGTTRPELSDRYDSDDSESVTDISCRVIADHVRAVTFSITDGALPSNEGRGYVVRRLLRRAARYGRKLDMHEPFIYKLVPTVVKLMGKAFPELYDRADLVAETIRTEEEAFGRTLDRGLEIFEQAAGRVARKGQKVFPGDEAFRLYDTYGFPLDLTQLLARERGLTVDEGEFNRLMDEQRERARAAGKTAEGIELSLTNVATPPTDDSFKYDPAMKMEAKLLGWVRDGLWIDQGALSAPAEVGLVVDRTCFYAEAGGQVGDQGVICSDDAEFIVEDTQKVNDRTVLHRGKLTKGTLIVDSQVQLSVNADRRKLTMNNHTATHLMQWALRQILGEHVKQAGSLVCDDYLRFDFTHNKALSEEQIDNVEQLVREKIDASLPVTIRQMTLQEALDMGVTALFGEKYGQEVRVVSIGETDSDKLEQSFSKELCGGTHVANTAAIMDFKIMREESLQTGVRRITAKTGRALRDLLHQRYKAVGQLSQLLKVPPEQTVERVQALLEENRKLKKQLRDGPASVDVAAAVDQLVQKQIKMGDAVAIVGELPNVSAERIRAQLDRLKKKTKSLVVVFGTRSEEKVLLLAAVTDDLIKQGISAGELVKHIAKTVGGGGGGKAHLAQAGGKLPDKLPEALAEAEKLIREKLM